MMSAGGMTRLEGLPANVATVLTNFLDEARDTLGDDLVSAVLFGSAAEARLTATSDVNLILVLRAFGPATLRQLSDPLAAGKTAIQLQVMFLLENEIPAAVELFAQKFAYILRRHRIVFGKQVFAGTVVPRNAEIFRLRQILLNLTLRLREAYVSRGQGEQARAPPVRPVIAQPARNSRIASSRSNRYSRCRSASPRSEVSVGSRARTSCASLRAGSSSTPCVSIRAPLNPGMPDCRVPSTSPSPRSRRSSSAMRNPSSVSRRIWMRAFAVSPSGAR